MSEEGAGSQGGQPTGASPPAGSPTGSATVDWSKGGAEHFASFKESLGDVGKDKSLEAIKDFHGLGKSYVEGQKMIGRGLYLPKEGIPEEERKKSIDGIMDKLRKANVIEAIPESPDKYAIEMPEKDNQGNPFQVNQPLLKSFREAAHKMGISPTAAQGLFNWYLNFQAEADATEQKAFEEMKSGLKKEWGGLYARNMEAARRAAFKYIGEDSDEVISSLPPAVGKRIVSAFAQIGDGLLEDDIITGNIKGMPTKDETLKKLQTMLSDPKHPLNDVSARGHAEALEEYKKLNAMYVQMK